MENRHTIAWMFMGRALPLVFRVFGPACNSLLGRKRTKKQYPTNQVP